MHRNYESESRKAKRAYWNKRVAERGHLLAVAPTGWMNRLTNTLEKAGCSGEQALELVIDIFRVIQNNLMEQVMLVTAERWHSITSQKPDHPIRILEVGVGTGEFAVRMLPLIVQKGAISIGVDFAENMIACTKERLIKGMHMPQNAVNLIQGDATRLPCENKSMWLVVWGKFGEHLTDNVDWSNALEEIKRVLRPNGFFLLYDPLQEGNPNYQRKPRKSKGTFIRSINEYDEALTGYKRVATLYYQFCREIYTIALWQNS